MAAALLPSSAYRGDEETLGHGDDYKDNYEETPGHGEMTRRCLGAGTTAKRHRGVLLSTLSLLL